MPPLDTAKTDILPGAPARATGQPLDRIDGPDKVTGRAQYSADFAMPGMNGVEVAQAARSRRPQLPIMFLTGYAEAPAMAGENKDRILQKPFRTEELARRLTAVLAPACGAVACGASL